MRPDTVFLEEPREQNQFRNDFIKQISTPPQPEPFTLYADDMHRAVLEDVQVQNLPTDMKDVIGSFFKRRQYRL